MNNEKMYSANDVCKALKITNYTLSNWYRWERKRVSEGCEPYLPQPQKLEHTKGSPRLWTKEMVEELRLYQKNIVSGRNGIYGVYSNPYHKETKKYKKSLETVANE